MTKRSNRVFSAFLISVPLLLASCQSVATDEVALSEPETELSNLASPDYARAETLRDRKLSSLVVNADPVPNWIGDGEAFWIALQNGAGFRYEKIESASGARAPLFDHDLLAAALSAQLDEDVSSDALPVSLISYDPDQNSIIGRAGTTVLSCDLDDQACEPVAASAPRNPALSYSPDGQMAALIKDHNIWVQDFASQSEQALTSDGAPYFSYGKYPDASLMAIPLQRMGANLAPFASFWSPDSRFFVTTRYDERGVEPYPFVALAPQDGSVKPNLYELRVPVVGDPQTPQPETHIFDIASGTSYAAKTRDGFTIQPGGLVGWNEAGDKAYMLATTTGLKSIRLVELSAQGERAVYEESREEGYVRLGPAIYNAPGARLINNGTELLWYSERSGWGHLYRIDLETGEVLNALTGGDWTVFDIISIDETSETVFFTAGGREPDRDPYYRHLYKVKFDGSGLTLLTEEDADHSFPGDPSFYFQTLFGLPLSPQRISPNGEFIVSSYSTLNSPPKTVLRNVETSEVIAEISSADVSQLEALDYRPPERFEAVAADGETKIYGAIHLPLDFDPEQSYPVINAIYAGPQVASAGIKYTDAFTGFGNTERTALASLGFIVVTIDGRGTPYRSLEFQNFSRGTGHGDITLEDNRAALEQLAEVRPYMDLNRVGVAGHSWGGYHATRAILLHNDFYKAAVSSAGIQGYEWSYPSAEVYVGVQDFGEGKTYRENPSDIPENLARVGNARLVERLQGDLLLVYGDLDENVRPVQTVRLIDALTKANKNYDLIILPNRNHYFSEEDYFVRRKFEYLVEHVMEADSSKARQRAPDE